MNLMEVYYFSVLAEQKKISVASSMLNITQETLINNMKSLQSDIGHQLFIQKGNEIILTQSGDEYYKKINHASESLLSLKSSDAVKKDDRPVIRLSMNACSLLLPLMFNAFAETHPDIRLQVLRQAARDIPCDLYIESCKELPDDDNSVVLIKERMAFVVNPKNPLAGLEQMECRRLSSTSIIMHSRNNRLRHIITDGLRSAGIEPAVTVETDETQTMRAMLESSATIGAILPTATVADMLDNLTIIPLIDPMIYRYVVLSWDENSTETETREAAIDFIIDFFNHLPSTQKRPMIQTFGHFDVYIKGKPVYFTSKKAKELLALLVDAQGGMVSMERAISILWEDEPYDEKLKKRYRSVVISLRDTLKENELEEIVSFKRAGAFINTEAVICDLYEFNGKNPNYLIKFDNEYMSDYAWGEERIPHLMQNP